MTVIQFPKAHSADQSVEPVRPCVRCGRHVARASWTTPEGVACASCARYVKPPVPCGICGRFSHHVARDFKQGINVPACAKCRRKGHVTCSVCRKHRPYHSRSAAGRPVCKKCSERTQPWVCTSCGKPGVPHSKTRCTNCYWKDYLGRKISDSIVLLHHEWAKTAFREFAIALGDRRGTKVAALRLDHGFAFFAKLDATFSRLDEIDASRLITAFGSRRILRRHLTAIDFLRTTGRVTEATQRQLSDDAREKRIEGIIRRQQGQWYHKLLTGLHELYKRSRALRQKRGWVGSRERIGTKTIVCAMTVAERFFEFVSANGASSLLSIEQQHVDAFLGAYPGHRAGLSSVLTRLRHANKGFGRLVVPSTPKPFRNELLLGPGKQRELLARCMEANERQLTLAMPVSLLTMFPVRSTKALRLRRTDVEALEDGTFTLKFHKVPVPITGDLAVLLKRFLERYRGKETFPGSDGNEFLFPGKVAGHHIRSESLKYFLKDITLDQLFSSALYGMFKSGLRAPAVLTEAFGITPQTTVKYLVLVQPQLERHGVRSLKIRERWVQAENASAMMH